MQKHAQLLAEKYCEKIAIAPTRKLIDLLQPATQCNKHFKMNEVIEIIELSIAQQNTIDQSFKAEYLKDDIILNKMLDYDFDDLDD